LTAAVSEPLRISFARLCRETRVLLDITQEQLSASVGISRSHLAEIETARVNPTLDVVTRIGDALGLELQLLARQPRVTDPRATGLVHSRCSGYVGRRMGGFGWSVRREVEIVHGNSHGWIDLLAYHPVTRMLVIVEIKTRLEDLGLIERQLAWYERAAFDVATRFEWHPTRVASWLLMLASEEVEGAMRREREAIRIAFPVRAREMRSVATEGATSTGQRGLALIDPSSRRAAWLIPSRLDGRRSSAPYRDYADAARRMDA
jgi:transcriptional regulator with XRE-family HTH domain